MDHPRYDVEARIAEILAAAALALVGGLLLWPPGRVYWTGVADVLGETPTLALVATLAALLGVWFARTAGLALTHVLVGALLAYAAGMAAIEVLLRPESPAHLVWYGALLACAVGGATFWRGVERVQRRRRTGESDA